MLQDCSACLPARPSPRGGHAPWTSPQARPGSGPGSWRSAQGPAAQAVPMRGPPGNPGQSCPPGEAAKGGWRWYLVLLLNLLTRHSGGGTRWAQIPAAPGAGAGEALSRSQRAVAVGENGVLWDRRGASIMRWPGCSEATTHGDSGTTDTTGATGFVLSHLLGRGCPELWARMASLGKPSQAQRHTPHLSESGGSPSWSSSGTE